MFGKIRRMQQQEEPVTPSSAVNDEPVLSLDDINTLAKFLDALMEADFENSGNERLVTNAC